jgi:hypothetical protein
MIGFNYLGKMGQLGNQMFQYAAVKGIAANRGYNYCIPNHNEVVVDNLGNKLRIELFNVFKMSNCSALNLQIIDQSRPDVQEEGFHFDENLFKNCADWVNLVGFFQSEKYFKNIEQEIHQDFEFIDQIKQPCEEMINVVSDPICLHIRRGDFLKNSGNHHNLSISYYEKALSKFDSDRNVIIFSDDPKWCKEQDLFSDDRFLVAEGNTSYVDLCLMSLCSDFIIANSTFSWWGAWLANKGRVIAPSKWFGPNNAHLNTKDLYPEGWEIINE